MTAFTKDSGISWEAWYDELSVQARKLGISVAHEEAWQPCWENNREPLDAIYENYPEFKPAAAEAEACEHKQHNRPCSACPWLKTSAPGWLGAMAPGEFLALADSGHRMPCHSAVDYDSKNWKQQADVAPQCAGHAVFLANRCKQPTRGALKLPADPEKVFSRPHEFVAHHARVAPASLERTLIYDLYLVGNDKAA